MVQNRKKYHVTMEFYCDNPEGVDINTKEDGVFIKVKAELNTEQDPILK